ADRIGAEGLAGDGDLGHVVLGRRAEADFDLEAGAAEEVGVVGAEFGEDGIADVAPGVADGGGHVHLDTIGVEGGAGEGRRDVGQERHGEEVAAAGGEDAADLAEGGGEVGDVFERLGGQDQVEGPVGVGQSGQVFDADAVDLGAGRGV